MEATYSEAIEEEFVLEAVVVADVMDQVMVNQTLPFNDKL